LPTLERPANAISGMSGAGSSLRSNTLVKKLTSVKFCFAMIDTGINYRVISKGKNEVIGIH